MAPSLRKERDRLGRLASQNGYGNPRGDGVFVAPSLNAMLLERRIWVYAASANLPRTHSSADRASPARETSPARCGSRS